MFRQKALPTYPRFESEDPVVEKSWDLRGNGQSMKFVAIHEWWYGMCEVFFWLPAYIIPIFFGGAGIFTTRFFKDSFMRWHTHCVRWGNLGHSCQKNNKSRSEGPISCRSPKDILGKIGNRFSPEDLEAKHRPLLKRFQAIVLMTSIRSWNLACREELKRTLLGTNISHQNSLLSRWVSFSPGGICDRSLEGIPYSVCVYYKDPGIPRTISNCRVLIRRWQVPSCVSCKFH